MKSAVKDNDKAMRKAEIPAWKRALLEKKDTGRYNMIYIELLNASMVFVMVAACAIASYLQCGTSE